MLKLKEVLNIFKKSFLLEFNKLMHKPNGTILECMHIHSRGI